jgi:membrane associated rhomboid family serine protease
MTYYSPQIGFAGRFTKTVKYLILANILLFIAKFFFSQVSYKSFLFTWSLVPGYCLNKLMLWQPFTYIFIHLSGWQLFINMLILWMFGSEVEEELGSKNFLIYYIFCGLGAGLLFLLLAGDKDILIGASSSILGVLFAFGMLFPERIITLLLLFVIPVSLKAKYLVAISGTIVLVTSLNGPTLHIPSFSILGGMLFGYFYLKKRRKAEYLIDKYFSKNKAKFITPKITIQKVFSPKVKERKKMKTREEKVNKEVFISKEIDPILDKISKEGIHSLSEEEKKKLDKAKHLME